MNQTIPILLIGGIFMAVVTVGLVVMVVHFKRMSDELNILNQKRYDDLRKRIEETNELVINQTKDLIDNIQKLLNGN